MSVAIVTGGSRGIGAAICVALAARGWDLCVGYRAEEGAARAVQAACEAHGVRAVLAQGDVSTEAGVAALFEVADGLGPLGALVNNAGIVDLVTRVEDMSAARVTRMMNVNVVGPFLCSAAAVKRMSTTHGGAGGVIVNIGSIAARLPNPGRYIDYAASKAALDVLTVGLSREVAAEGIRVNCVRPGIVDTEIHADAGQPDRVQHVAGDIPMQRVGQPEEIAATVAWLCSDEAGYVSGAIVDVGGAI